MRLEVASRVVQQPKKFVWGNMELKRAGVKSALHAEKVAQMQRRSYTNLRLYLCRVRQHRFSLVHPISLNLRIACATVVLPGKNFFLGENNFWPGASSFCQPAHSSGANELGCARCPWHSSDPLRLLVGHHPAKIRPDWRRRFRNQALSSNVPLGRIA